MVGVANGRRGDGLGEPKGDAVDDLLRLKLEGTKLGGTSGLTPRRGDPDNGVADPRQEAGDGLRRIVCRIGGGDVAFPPPSRYLQSASNIAFSRPWPVRLVFAFSKSSSLSVFSSSSMLGSSRMGRQISYVSSETMFAPVEASSLHSR